MTNKKCNSCWWQEGGRCYNEGFAIITVVNLDLSRQRLGEMIDNSTLERCDSIDGYLNKRTALESVIPGDKLVILSERKAQKEAI